MQNALLTIMMMCLFLWLLRREFRAIKRRSHKSFMPKLQFTVIINGITLKGTTMDTLELLDDEQIEGLAIDKDSIVDKKGKKAEVEDPKFVSSNEASLSAMPYTAPGATEPDPYACTLVAGEPGVGILTVSVDPKLGPEVGILSVDIPFVVKGGEAVAFGFKIPAATKQP